jgi:hypothetical protein
MSEEYILSAFAAAPFEIGDNTFAVETPGHAALIGEEDAIIADVYNGRIGRLWRIGGLDQSTDERRLHVAFDVDMAQARPQSLLFRQDDHPELPLDETAELLTDCEAFIDGRRRSGNLRARGFVVRAFGDQTTRAALLSLFTLSDKHERSASFDFAVVARTADGETRCVFGEPNPGLWTPRLS